MLGQLARYAAVGGLATLAHWLLLAVLVERGHWAPWLASGAVKPVIYKTFAAADAADAHVLMESNQHIGKLVLCW